jgi:hypothetical protein
MTTSKSAAVGAATLALVALAARPVLAQDHASCNAIELMMTKGDKPELPDQAKPLEKKLKKPPFSSWNVFHTLASGHVTLQKLKADTLKLKSGQAALLLRERAEKRLELTIQIDNADGKRVIDNKQSVNTGEWLVFGQNVGDNGHILALTCR